MTSVADKHGSQRMDSTDFDDIASCAVSL